MVRGAAARARNYVDAIALALGNSYTAAVKLTKDQVNHVATLARIAVTETEVEKFQTQLSGILDYVSQLNEVNTDGVMPTAQVTGLTNVMRSDAAVTRGSLNSLADPEKLLACSPLPIEDNQIKVKSVF